MGCVGINTTKGANQAVPNNKAQVFRYTQTGNDSMLKFQPQNSNSNSKQQNQNLRLQNKNKNNQIYLTSIAQQTSQKVKSASINPELQDKEKMRLIQKPKRQMQQQNNYSMVHSEIYEKPIIIIQNYKTSKSAITQSQIRPQNATEIMKGKQKQVIEPPIQATNIQNIMQESNKQNEVKIIERKQLQQSRRYTKQQTDIVQEWPRKDILTIQEQLQLNKKSMIRKKLQFDVNKVGSNVPQQSNQCVNLFGQFRNIFN